MCVASFAARGGSCHLPDNCRVPVHHQLLPSQRRRRRRECVDGDGVPSPGHSGTAATTAKGLDGTAATTIKGFDRTPTKRVDEIIGNIGEARTVYVGETPVKPDTRVIWEIAICKK